LSEFEDKDKLVARIDKYQKWAEKMEFEIKKDNSLVRVALYAIDGKDDMKPPEELPGEDAATIEKNKDIKEAEGRLRQLQESWTSCNRMQIESRGKSQKGDYLLPMQQARAHCEKLSETAKGHSCRRERTIIQ